ncbi:MAG: dihydropteroate synthase, partial [Patescibacteria group bacterium]
TKEVHYDNVIQTIHQFFEERLAAALKAGVRKEQLILDPGLGHFISSDPRYSWEILERLEELSDLGCPILVSPSRKSFTAEHPKQLPSERLPGTLRATKIALAHGASIIRTHDVAATKRILRDW